MIRESVRGGVALALFALLGLSDASAGRDRPNLDALIPSIHIFVRLIESKHGYLYGFAPATLMPEDCAEALWPAGPDVPFPTVEVDASGKRQVGMFACEEEAFSAIDEAVEAFRKGSYDQAIEGNRKALRADPNCYIAHSLLGDCHHALHRYEEALRHYEKAVSINPWDHRLVAHRASTLLALGRRKAAREAYVQALVLRPRLPHTMEYLRGGAGLLGVELVEDPFLPRGLVRRAGKKKVEILSREDAGAYWTCYLMCKALWLGEPSFRREVLGRKDHVWTSIEEAHCILNMVHMYQGDLEKGEGARDPLLDRIEQAQEARLLKAFVLYEIGSRMDPHLTLRLEDEEREEIRDYVTRFVVVSRID